METHGMDRTWLGSWGHEAGEGGSDATPGAPWARRSRFLLRGYSRTRTRTRDAFLEHRPGCILELGDTILLTWRD